MRIAKTSLLAAILWLPLAAQTPLPKTAALTGQGDFAAQMVDGINDYLVHASSESLGKRTTLWKRDYTSVENYERSIAPNRERLKKMLGIVDERTKDGAPEFAVPVGATSAVVASSAAFQARNVRWPVLRSIEGEGLLLEPKTPSGSFAIVFPDADQTPEMITGIVPGVA